MRRAVVRVVIAVVASGCGRNPDVVTVRVVDRLVEVRQTPLAPFPGMERMWKRTHPDRVDTVPGVRAIGSVTVVGENRVIGFHAEEQGAPVMFEYDAFSRTLKLSPLPRWVGEAVFDPPPAFAPGGRYILFLARRPPGMVRVEVRSWPDGAELIAGPPLRLNPESSNRAWVSWWGATDVFAMVPVVSDTGPVVLRFKGRVSGTQAWLDSAERYVDVERPKMASGLRPSALPGLPRAFRAELERRGCTVPQSHRGENVISGRFAASTQVDWAALCSLRGQSMILVHWGGAAQCPRELRPAPDQNYQTRDGDHLAFTRSIHTTNRYQVHDDMGRPVLPERFVDLEHDAIEDLNEGWASTVWSCQDGKWIEFPGRGSRKVRLPIR